MASTIRATSTNFIGDASFGPITSISRSSNSEISMFEKGVDSHQATNGSKAASTSLAICSISSDVFFLRKFINHGCKHIIRVIK